MLYADSASLRLSEEIRASVDGSDRTAEAERRLAEEQARVSVENRGYSAYRCLMRVDATSVMTGRSAVHHAVTALAVASQTSPMEQQSNV